MDSYKDYSYLNMAQSKPKRNKDSFGHLMLFWILPFVLINLVIFFAVTSEPKFTIDVIDPGHYDSADIHVTIDSLIPLKSLEAQFLGEPLELKKESSRSYRATVYTTGTFEVRASNYNGMVTTQYDTVNTIDDAPPAFTEYSRDTGYIAFYVDDPQSGVDFSTLRAVDDAGKEVIPSLLDEGESLVVYNYEGSHLEVHVHDKAGHEGVALFESGPAAPMIEIQ